MVPRAPSERMQESIRGSPVALKMFPGPPIWLEIRVGVGYISVGSIQGHPWLDTELSLGNMRPCLKTKVDTHDAPATCVATSSPECANSNTTLKLAATGLEC